MDPHDAAARPGRADKDLFADEVDALVAEARVAARARARERLTEIMAETLLSQALERLEAPGKPARKPAPRHVGQPAPEPAPRPARSEPAPRPARSQPPSRHAPATADAELGWYLYGVLRATDAVPGDPQEGVHSELPPLIVVEGRLAAVASRVPMSEFGESELRENLADMEWVARAAERHEAVLDHIVPEATVVPMRMCTVYRTEAGVRELLRREAASLEQALERLEAKREWSVKVLADVAALNAAAEAATALGGGDADSPGRAYMAERQRELGAAERAAQLVDQAAARIHEMLADLAVQAVVLPNQPAQATGLPGDTVLNGAYLVAGEGEAAFHERVAELHEEFEPAGLTVRESGPWPPYNFVPDAIGAAW